MYEETDGNTVEEDGRIKYWMRSKRRDCTTVLHRGVYRQTSIPHKSGNRITEIILEYYVSRNNRSWPGKQSTDRVSTHRTCQVCRGAPATVAPGWRRTVRDTRYRPSSLSVPRTSKRSCTSRSWAGRSTFGGRLGSVIRAGVASWSRASSLRASCKKTVNSYPGRYALGSDYGWWWSVLKPGFI